MVNVYRLSVAVEDERHTALMVDGELVTEGGERGMSNVGWWMKVWGWMRVD